MPVVAILDGSPRTAKATPAKAENPSTEAKQMRQTFATSCGLILMLLSSSANAADILIAEMEDFRGEKTVHTQTMSGEKCDAFLSKLRKLKTKKTRMQLTFEDPPFSGYVVEAQC